jgi:hypothetical protein
MLSSTLTAALDVLATVASAASIPSYTKAVPINATLVTRNFIEERSTLLDKRDNPHLYVWPKGSTGCTTGDHYYISNGGCSSSVRRDEERSSHCRDYRVQR